MTGKETAKSRKVREKLEHRLKVVEKRDRMLIKDFSSERAVFEEVFDRSTLIVIYNFLKKGTISEIHGVVKAGKESRVYWGKDEQGNELAIKIYLTISAEFRKGMLKYIEGDPRFKRIRRSTRSLVFAWALKEFKNLQQATAAKIRVPHPIAVEKNVLIMEFIGKNGISAPSLKEKPPKNPERTYKTLLTYLRQLYSKAELVHGDLSEYNIMIWKGHPVLFDMSQAVLLSHPLADSLLDRDLKNLNRYFSRLGVKVLAVDEYYRRITGHDRS